MITCKNCGNEYDGVSCPNCGTPCSDDPVVVMMKQKAMKKAKNKRKIVIAVTVILIMGVIGGIITAIEGKNSPAGTSSQPSSSSQSVSQSTTSSSSEVQSSTTNVETAEEYIASCETISYEDLARNPEKYKGSRFTFTGQVVQTMESTSIFSSGTNLEMRINVTQGEYGLWTDTIYATLVLPEGEDRILENDVIRIYGECEGLQTYTTVLGAQASLPKIKIQYYQIAK